MVSPLLSYMYMNFFRDIRDHPAQRVHKATFTPIHDKTRLDNIRLPSESPPPIVLKNPNDAHVKPHNSPNR